MLALSFLTLVGGALVAHQSTGLVTPHRKPFAVEQWCYDQQTPGIGQRYRVIAVAGCVGAEAVQYQQDGAAGVLRRLVGVELDDFSADADAALAAAGGDGLGAQRCGADGADQQCGQAQPAFH